MAAGIIKVRYPIGLFVPRGIPPSYPRAFARTLGASLSVEITLVLRSAPVAPIQIHSNESAAPRKNSDRPVTSVEHRHEQSILKDSARAQLWRQNEPATGSEDPVALISLNGGSRRCGSSFIHDVAR